MYARMLILVSVLLSGCATLDVQVDVFDHKGLTADDTLRGSAERQAARHAYLRGAGSYEKTKVQLESDLEAHLNVLAGPEIAIVAKSDVSTFMISGRKVIEASIAEAIRAREAGAELVRQAADTLDTKQRRVLYQQAQAEFESAMRSLVELRTKMRKLYQEPLGVKLKTLQNAGESGVQGLNAILFAEAKFETRILENVGSLTGGQDLLSDPIAAVVISSDEKYWKGNFNKANANGRFGNTDIAIKMETLGTFTIKGVRLDAGKVTEASFQVLNQAVRMVAAAYGVPSAGPEQEAETAGGNGPSDLMQTVGQQMQAAEHKKRLSQSAALTLMDIIVAEQDLLASDPAKRRAAIQRVKQSFAAYKTQLAGQ